MAIIIIVIIIILHYNTMRAPTERVSGRGVAVIRSKPLRRRNPLK